MAVVRRTLSAAVLASATAASVLSGAQVAYAQPEWVLPLTTLSPAGPIGWPPVVSTDADGDATALYATAKSSGAGAETLLSVDHPAGGVWGQPTTVASGGNAGQVELATGADGELTAVWVDSTDGNSFQVWTAERAGGTWSSATQLAFNGKSTDTVNSPGVAEDGRGNVVAAWTESDQQHSATWLVAAYRHAGTWGAPTRLSVPSAHVLEGAPIQVTVDAQGDFVVAWSQYAAQTGIYAVESEQLIGGAWQGEQTVESGGDSVGPVALEGDAAGDTTAVWADVQKQSVRSAILRNGAWTAAGAAGGYSPQVCQAPLPQVAVDGAGGTTSVWVLASGQVAARSLSAGGVWSGYTQTLSKLPLGDTAYHPQIAVDAGGDTVVSWSYYDAAAGATFVQVVVRAAGGVWGAPTTLAGPDGADTATSLALDAQGNAIQAWASSPDSSNYAIDAVGFEVAPVVSDLTVPIQASTRRVASFSAGTAGPWATITSAHWDFGDGTHADTAAATHVYTRAGVYKVQLTVTDSLLNQVTVARQVTVTTTPQAPSNSNSTGNSSGTSTGTGSSTSTSTGAGTGSGTSSGSGATSGAGVGVASGTGSGLTSGVATGSGGGTDAATNGAAQADGTVVSGGAARALPTLAPVYLVVPRQRLWLARGARTVSVMVRNANAFRVTGAVSLVDYSQTATLSAVGVAAAPSITTAGRFRLAAHSKGRVRLRVGASALVRLRAQALSKGYGLVRVRIAIRGASGQTAFGSSTYALNTPLGTRRGQLRPLSVQPSYAAPTNPWARGDC